MQLNYNPRELIIPVAECYTVISKMNNIIVLHCLMLTEHIRNQYNTAPDKSFKTIIQERCAVLIWAKGSGSDWNGVILLVFNNIKFCWGKVVSQEVQKIQKIQRLPANVLAQAALNLFLDLSMFVPSTLFWEEEKNTTKHSYSKCI